MSCIRQVDIDSVKHLLKGTKVDLNELCTWNSSRTPSPSLQNEQYEPESCEYKATALNLAVFTGDVGLVSYLLDNGADVNLRDSRGRTALICAIYGIDTLTLDTSTLACITKQELGHARVMDRLLRQPTLSLSSLNAPQDAIKGITPLALASYLGKDRIVASLLQDGTHCQVNSCDRNGATALMYAARDGQSRVVELLLKHGASAEMTDINGCSAIQYGCQYPAIACMCEMALRKQRIGAVQRLLNDLPTVAIGDIKSSKFFTEVYNFLAKESGFHIDEGMIDQDCLSANHAALTQAIRIKDIACIESMLLLPSLWVSSGKANADEEGLANSLTLANYHEPSSGLTPLHHALRSRPLPCLETILMLYQAGADLNAQTQYGRTALHHLCRFGATVSVRSRRRSMTSSVGSAGITEDGSALTSSGPTVSKDLAEHLALLAKILIKLGACINQTDANGYTPLMFTAQYQGLPEVVQVLLDNGADIGVRNSKGHRAIDLAMENIKNLLQDQQTPQNRASLDRPGSISSNTSYGSSKRRSSSASTLVPLSAHDVDIHFNQILNNFDHYTSNMSGQIEASLESFIEQYKKDGHVEAVKTFVNKRMSTMDLSKADDEGLAGFQQSLVDVKTDLRNANAFFTFTSDLCGHLLTWYRQQIADSEAAIEDMQNEQVTEIKAVLQDLWNQQVDLTKAQNSLSEEMKRFEVVQDSTLQESSDRESLATAINEISAKISLAEEKFADSDSDDTSKVLQELSVLIGEAMATFEPRIKECRENVRKGKRALIKSSTDERPELLEALTTEERHLEELMHVQETLKARFQKAQQAIHSNSHVDTLRRASQLIRQSSVRSVSSHASEMARIDSIFDESAVSQKHRASSQPVSILHSASDLTQDAPIPAGQADSKEVDTFCSLQIEYDLITANNEERQHEIEGLQVRQKRLGKLKSDLYHTCLELEAEERGIGLDKEIAERDGEEFHATLGDHESRRQLSELQDKKAEIMAMTQVVFAKEQQLTIDICKLENQIFRAEQQANALLLRMRKSSPSQILQGFLDNMEMFEVGPESLPDIRYRPELAYCQVVKGQEVRSNLTIDQGAARTQKMHMKQILIKQGLIKIRQQLNTSTDTLKKGESEVLSVTLSLEAAKKALVEVKEALQQLEVLLIEKLHVRKNEIANLWSLVQDMINAATDDVADAEMIRRFEERVEGYLASKAAVDIDEPAGMAECSKTQAQVTNTLDKAVNDINIHQRRSIGYITYMLEAVTRTLSQVKEDAVYTKQLICGVGRGGRSLLNESPTTIVKPTSAGFEAFMQLSMTSNEAADATSDADLDDVLSTPTMNGLANPNLKLQQLLYTQNGGNVRSRSVNGTLPSPGWFASIPAVITTAASTPSRFGDQASEGKRSSPSTAKPVSDRTLAYPQLGSPVVEWHDGPKSDGLGIC